MYVIGTEFSFHARKIILRLLFLFVCLFVCSFDENRLFFLVVVAAATAVCCVSLWMCSKVLLFTNLLSVIAFTWIYHPFNTLPTHAFDSTFWSPSLKQLSHSTINLDFLSISSVSISHFNRNFRWNLSSFAFSQSFMGKKCPVLFSFCTHQMKLKRVKKC